jgi:hypothetical protein
MMPALSEDEIEQIFRVPYRLTYAPWIEFTSPDMSNPNFNVRDHLRATVPEFSSRRDGALEVFFFGGSTMFGVHVADDATLPSAFSAEASRDQSLSLRSTNFGTSYYYLKQEAVLFTSMLLDGRKPRVAVFLDGLNDLIEAGASQARAPFFSRSMQWIFDQPAEKITLRGLIARTSLGQLRLGKLDGRKISESVPSELIEWGFVLPAGVDEEQGSLSNAQAYITNVRHTAQICKSAGIVCLFFLQPVPFTSYDRSADPIADKRTFRSFQIGYPAIKDALKTEPDFIPLDEAFAAPKTLPYVDAFHYSPYGNNVLAKLIYQHVRQRLLAARS